MSSRRIILLGSTGSIGTRTLDVVRALAQDSTHSDGVKFSIAALAAGTNASVLLEQIAEWRPAHVSVACPEAASRIKAEHPELDVRSGADAATALVREIARPGDLAVCAMVGVCGLPATLAAIEAGCDVALANKESLVAAGALVMAAAERRGVAVRPIDSEHSAIAQCLASGRASEIARIVLTASGGPFRGWSAARLASATVDEALAHPTWQMGRKITVDSATLVNKALEVIEAHALFGLPASAIDVLVHPQSIVHGLIEFADGSVMAQMAAPDMAGPIQYALTGGRRPAGCAARMDLAALRQLDFEPVDHETFPAVGLARRVIERGGTAGAVFNAANEEAVHQFLSGKIDLPSIVSLAAAALDAVPQRALNSLEDVRAADAAARDFVRAETGVVVPRAAGSL